MQWQLPSDLRWSDEVSMSFSFYEMKINGTDKIQYVVEATETDAEVPVWDKLYFSSWDDMKTEYPTLQEILAEFMHSDLWYGNNSIFYIGDIEGNVGLYDITETVYIDAQEDF